MVEPRAIEKVACFALRRRAAGSELLVIRHPTAGTQLPAGTVELGESGEAAALREFHEETGRQAARAWIIGTVEHRVPPPNAVLNGTPKVVDRIACAGSADHLRLRRGLPIRVVAHDGGRAHVIYEELDYNVFPPRVLTSVSGWVDDTFISRRVVRYLCRVETVDGADRTWSFESDGQSWRLEWAPTQGLTLFGDQQTWLEQVIMRLT